MKKIILLLLLSSVLFTTYAFAQDKWTWMLYLLEDGTGLSGVDDINEWEANGSTNDVNYLVLFDAQDDSQDGVYYITKDPNGYDSTIRSSIVYTGFGTDPDMSDWHTLRDYMNWCATNYPADHYGLTLWDHGSGIFKGEVSQGGIFGNITGGNTTDTKDFVDGMKLWELDDALSDFTTNIGRKVDIVGFDVCLLGHIETAYQMKDHVDYVIASEKTEPGDGWDYVAGFSDLTSNGNITASQQATNIVNSYVTFYGGKNGQSDGVTQAATSTAALESDLIPALNTFADKLRRDVYNYETKVKAARDGASYWDSDDYGSFYLQQRDLGSFAQNIVDDTTLPSDLRTAAQDVLDAIGTAVIAEGHTVGDPAYGLKIWMPEDIDNDSNETYYTDPNNYLTFCNTLWDEFLYNYNNPQPYDSDRPPVQNLTATVGDGVVTLNWDAPAKNTLDHYKVDRNGSTIANYISVGTTTYTDNSVTNGTTYNYDVYAVYTGTPSGDSSPSSVSATPHAPLSVPFTEDFENGGAIPNYWTEEYVSGNTSWAFQTGGHSGNPSGAHSGSYNACLYYGSQSGHETRLVTPRIDFGSNTDNPTLSFWHTQAKWSNDQDELRVYYKTSASGAWQLLATYTNDITAWTQETINLPATSSDFYIAFQGLAQYGYGVCIDDVQINGTAAGTPEFSVSPTSLDFGNVEVGQSSTLQFTITNTGTGGTLTGNITTPAGYTVAEAPTKGKGAKNTLSYSITDSKTFDVTFSPTAAQNYDGTVTITCDQDTPSNVTVTGTGIAADLITNPASLSQSMITDETATQNLRLENTGGATMNYTASVQYAKGRSTATVYPANSAYWTGSTNSSTKTQNSLVKGFDTEDGWMKFDISSIPDGATINSIEFHGYVNDTNYPYWAITPVTHDPVTTDAATLKNDISAEEGSGYYLYQEESSSYSTGWKVHTLGGTATTDLQNALAQDWFVIGIASTDNSSTYYIDFDGWNEANKPYLVVDYTVSASWLTINGGTSVSDSITPASFDNLTIGFNSAGLVAGTYNGIIHITSNDPDSPTDVNVTLTVASSTSNTGEGSNNNGDGTGSADVDVPPVTINGDNINPDVSVDPAGDIPIVVDITVNESQQHSGTVSGNTLISYTATVTGNINGVSLNFDLSYDGLSSTPQSLLWWDTSVSQWKTVDSPSWNTPSANHVSFNLTLPNTKDGSTEFILNDDETPLPVVFGYFNSVFNNGHAILQWTTMSEENSNYWNVYRALSNNYGQAKIINSQPIDAVNSTTETTTYTFVDNHEFESNTTYYYWVENVSLSGENSLYGPFELNVENNDDNNVPDIVQYGLHQNYPNPFNPDTNISFVLKQASNVTLEIYNAKGQRVKTLLNNTYVDKDKVVKLNWNGTDNQGRLVSSGLYFYKLNTGKKQFTKKMLLLK